GSSRIKQLVDEETLWLERLSPTISEQLPNQPGAMLSRLCGHCRQLGQLGVFLHCGKDLAVAQDYGEQIVEVVSDAASELSDGVHSLGSGRSFLQLVLLRHVATYAITSAVCLNPGHRPKHRDYGAIWPYMALPFRSGEIALRPSAVVQDGQCAIVFMDEIEPGAA